MVRLFVATVTVIVCVLELPLSFVVAARPVGVAEEAPPIPLGSPPDVAFAEEAPPPPVDIVIARARSPSLMTSHVGGVVLFCARPRSSARSSAAVNISIWCFIVFCVSTSDADLASASESRPRSAMTCASHFASKSRMVLANDCSVDAVWRDA